MAEETSSDGGAPPSDPSPSGAEIKIFLFADVRGYTRFTQERGDEAGARLAAKFVSVARSALEGGGGSVIEIAGDEALAVFNSPRQALRAAVDLQTRLGEETLADPTLPLRAGVGIDAGEAVPLEGGYRGGMLNTAARLCALAAPGEVLVTQEVVHLARRIEGLRFIEVGPLRLKGIERPVQVVQVVVEAVNPYRGLLPFEEADAPNFFGRESLTQQIIGRLTESGEGSRFLAVVGPSGCGKSSVVKAGVVPAVRAGALGGAAAVVAEMVPGQQPVKELVAVLERAGIGGDLETLLRSPEGLASIVDANLPNGSELFLVVDQFEELFTLVEDESMRAAFLEAVRAAVTHALGRVRCVVTLRADLYDRPLRYKDFGDLVGVRTQTVTSLAADELERAISGPAGRMGVTLEPGLVAQMVADLSDQPGALPLLQFALTELFEQRRGNAMTLDAYRKIGGISGALVRRAEGVYAGLDASEQEAARQLFLRLTTSVDETDFARRRVPRADLLAGGEVIAMEAVIDVFGAARLLSFDRDPIAGRPTVEVGHEALLGAWTRLREWLESARDDLATERRLASSARDWLEADKDPSFLAAGSRLSQFESWRERSALGPTPDEQEFLNASLAERDRVRDEEAARLMRETALERRSVRRLRALVAVLTLAAVVAAGITVFAFGQRGRAEREARIARARELASAAVANLEADPERSVLLAIAAINTTRSVDGSTLPEAVDALRRAVGASRVVLTVPGVGGHVDWSPRGVFVTGGPEGMVDIRDARTGESVLAFKAHVAGVNDAAFSPDGKLLATTGDGKAQEPLGQLKVWNAATGKLLFTRSGVVGAPSRANFNRDGTRVAASWGDEGVARVFDPSGRARPMIIKVPGVDATGLSPDGKRLAVTYGDRSEISVFDLATGKLVLQLQGHAGDVNAVAYSPNGRYFATAGSEGLVIVWDAKSGRLRFRLTGHTDSMTNIDWSADSSKLVSSSVDGTARVWAITDEGATALRTFSSESGVSAVISPDGTRVMTGTFDFEEPSKLAVKIWDLGPIAGAEWGTFPFQDAWPGSTRFMPEGRQLMTNGDKDSLRIWDLQTSKLIRTIVPDPQVRDRFEFDTWALSPDGRSVALAGLDGTARVLDVATGKEQFRVEHKLEVVDVAWSDDGTKLATTSLDGTAMIADRASGDVVGSLREDENFFFSSATFSPDGRTLVTSALTFRGAPASRVRFWDWSTKAVARTIGARGNVVVFDPEGARIAIAYPDGEPTVWNLSPFKPIATLKGHSGRVNDLAFSPDGSRVATAGADGNVRLFDADSGVLLLTLRGHSRSVSGLAFNDDGTKLASAAEDGTVRVWALDLDDLITIAKRDVSRTLTVDECRQYLHVPRCP